LRNQNEEIWQQNTKVGLQALSALNPQTKNMSAEPKLAKKVQWTCPHGKIASKKNALKMRAVAHSPVLKMRATTTNEIRSETEW
jgi:hypothetical protein